MFYDTGKNLYLKLENSYIEVYVKSSDGATSVVELGNKLEKRPVGAKRYSLEELIAQHHLVDGGCYPIQTTPKSAPQSGETPPAQPKPAESTAGYGVKPKK